MSKQRYAYKVALLVAGYIKTRAIKRELPNKREYTEQKRNGVKYSCCKRSGPECFEEVVQRVVLPCHM